MVLYEELKEFGLDEKEIKIYLACLSERGVSIKEIADKTGIIRTTIYGLTSSLLQKGFLSKVEKEGSMFLTAVNPQELINKLEYKKERLKSLIPEIEKLREDVDDLSKVDFYEGREAIKIITNDTISKKNELVKIIGAGKKWIDFSSSFADVYYRKKKENQVHTHTILKDTKEEKEFLKKKQYRNSTFKFLKNLEIETGAIFIYQDKVSFVSYVKNKERGFIAKDKEFNKALNSVFEKLWKDAKS